MRGWNEDAGPPDSAALPQGSSATGSQDSSAAGSQDSSAAGSQGHRGSPTGLQGGAVTGSQGSSSPGRSQGSSSPGRSQGSSPPGRSQGSSSPGRSQGSSSPSGRSQGSSSPGRSQGSSSPGRSQGSSPPGRSQGSSSPGRSQGSSSPGRSQGSSSPGRSQGSSSYGLLLVLSTLLVYIPVAGFANSFGVFVEMFDRDFCRRPDHCLELLGLISALALANFRLLCWMSVLLEALLPVPLVFLLGAVLCVVSMVTTSYVTNIYTLLLTHSLLFGFGSTFMMNSPLSSIEYYFPRSHGFHVLATGIVNLGPSIGVVVMNPLSVYLDSHERYSWRDTLQVFAVAILVCAALHLAAISKHYLCPRPEVYEELKDGGHAGRLAPWQPRTWLTLSTGSWIVAILGIGWAIYIPKTMFMQYMTEQGISEEDAALLLSYSGVSETVTSLAISLTGDLLGVHLPVPYIAASALLAVTNGLLPLLSGEEALGAYLVLHGACDGVLMTVLFGVVTILIPSPEAHGPLWALTNLAVGVGQVTGLPIAGMIYDKTGSYNLMFAMTCAVYSASTVLFAVAYVSNLRAQPISGHGKKCYDKTPDSEDKQTS